MAAPLIRLGFDEAGLGPTLGPLVVAGLGTSTGATRPLRAPVDDLHRLLGDVVAEPGTRDGRLELGDSKKIHTGPRKLARIERSALAGVAWVHGRIPTSVAELFECVVVRSHERPPDRRAPWWQMLDEALPVAASREAIERDAERLGAAAERAGVRALWFAADVLDAARVNRELAEEDQRVGGSKNTWATHTVLRLAAHALAELEAPESAVWCDKAGGRQAYVEPIVRAFAVNGPDEPVGLFGARGCVEIHSEVRERSCYLMQLDGRRVELGFVMGGDRLDPRISWGSILAKYLRELLLRAFNRYFAARVPGLRATAGYPEDALRFIADVEAGGAATLERAAWVRCK